MTTCIVIGCSGNTFESKICQDCWEKKPKSNMMEEYNPGVSIRKWLEKEGWGNVPKWNGPDSRALRLVQIKNQMAFIFLLLFQKMERKSE